MSKRSHPKLLVDVVANVTPRKFVGRKKDACDACTTHTHSNATQKVYVDTISVCIYHSSDTGDSVSHYDVRSVDVDGSVSFSR